MGKWFWVVLGVVIAGMVGVFFAMSEESAPRELLDNPHEITAEDHVTGAENPTVTLIEYGDFACPACGAVEPILQEVKADYSDDLQFVWRHFPVTGIAGYDASRATVAADQQGEFWAMHDVLFERQDEWRTSQNPRSFFDDYADELGLDSGQFRSDYGDARDRVERDNDIARQVEVTSTPTFFLNGEQIDNPGTYEGFAALIDAAIAEAENDDSEDGVSDEDSGEFTIPEEEDGDLE